MNPRYYVYCYHCPKLAAIKVGEGKEPAGRLKSYVYHHRLDADPASLRFWDVGYKGIGQTVEGHVRNKLMKAGHARVGHGNATELFSLNGQPYEEVLKFVTEMVRRKLRRIAKRLQAVQPEETIDELYRQDD